MVSLLEEVFLGQAEVDHVDFVRLLGVPYHEVVRLDVAVDESPVVDMLDSFYHLVPHHQSGFEVEFLPSLIKQVLERSAA